MVEYVLFLLIRLRLLWIIMTLSRTTKVELMLRKLEDSCEKCKLTTFKPELNCYRYVESTCKCTLDMA